MRAFDGEIMHLVNRHEFFKQALDLLDHRFGARGDDGDARMFFIMLDFGHRQRFDIIAAARK